MQPKKERTGYRSSPYTPDQQQVTQQVHTPQQQQQQGDAATFNAVHRLYGQTCHLRDNLSSFLATLGLFRQDVLPYDLVRSQAIEAEQVGTAYSASVANFSKGALAPHFGRFFTEITGFCSAMQPRLRTLIAGTMDSFSPGGIDASASLDAVEKLAQFFQSKLSAFAAVLEQTLGAEPQQSQQQQQQMMAPSQLQPHPVLQVQQQPQQHVPSSALRGAGARHAASPMSSEPRRPFEYGEPASNFRSAQSHTPRSALRAQAGIRSAGRSHPDNAVAPDLLSPTSSVGSFCEDGEGKRRRRSGASSRNKGPTYLHRTRVVVWRMETDADPSTIPPRMGTGHAVVMPTSKLTWAADEKPAELTVDVEIRNCVIKRFNLPWQNPAIGEEVQEKDKNVIWLTAKPSSGAANDGHLSASEDKENSSSVSLATTTPANRKRPRSVAGTPSASSKAHETSKPFTYFMRCFDSASAEEFCKILVECGASMED